MSNHDEEIEHDTDCMDCPACHILNVSEDPSFTYLAGVVMGSIFAEDAETEKAWDAHLCKIHRKMLDMLCESAARVYERRARIPHTEH